MCAVSPPSSPHLAVAEHRKATLKALIQEHLGVVERAMVGRGEMTHGSAACSQRWRWT